MKKNENMQSLPNNPEAEKALIAAILINPGILPAIEPIVLPEYFYTMKYRRIFQAVVNCEKKGIDINVITLADDLSQYSEYVGSSDVVRMLGELRDYITVSVDATSTAQIIQQAAKQRELILAGTKCIDSAHQGASSDDVEKIIPALENDLKKIKQAQMTYDCDVKNSLQIIHDITRDIEAGPGGNRKYSLGPETGFHNIDRYILGLEPKTTTYLIARPSVGKTALALNIAGNVARETNEKILYFSHESSAERLTRRRISAASGVPLTRIRMCDVTPGQQDIIFEAGNELSDIPFAIIDNPRYKVVERLTQLATTCAANEPISLIVVDHIQRMRSLKKFGSRALEISHVSEELTTLAVDLNLPILVLCQLNREIEKTKNQRPRLVDMKESGDLEQNADSVISIWRADKEAEIAEITGLKGRDSGVWNTELFFDRFIQKFQDMQERDDQLP